MTQYPRVCGSQLKELKGRNVCFLGKLNKVSKNFKLFRYFVIFRIKKMPSLDGGDDIESQLTTLNMDVNQNVKRICSIVDNLLAVTRTIRNRSKTAKFVQN